MPSFYDFERIDLRDACRNGHIVYKEARYPQGEGLAAKKIIYKKNKHNNPEYSLFEHAFSGLASLFLAPKLTPKQSLVKNVAGDLVGLASEHASYNARLRERMGQFYTIAAGQNTNACLSLTAVDESKDAPIYFLNQFPQGFFSQLCRARKRGELHFDLRSLASVLTSSYSLEEDDLHKGNFGFYLVEKRGKKRLVFFKIDHDLMMVDSLMSHYGFRITNWHYGNSAFGITRTDLQHFPKLHHSRNYYWPATRLFLTNPFDSKTYSNSAEIKAFVRLAKSKAFQLEKWRQFYKHILIPPALIKQTLEQTFSTDSPADRANIALIMDAVLGRQAKLRAVLFSIPSFRHFLKGLTPTAQRVLIRETLQGNEDGREELMADMAHYRDLCQSPDGFVKGDTPLHVTIRLRDYRYQDSWKAFACFANQPNSKGERPMDLALAWAKNEIYSPLGNPDPRKDPRLVVKSLLIDGAKKTGTFKLLSQEEQASIENYAYKTDYLDAARETNNLVVLLQLVGEDHRYCLKMKKEIAIAVLREFLGKNPLAREPDYLLAFKAALNGRSARDAAPELQFIRQLRSRLWIVRTIRGLLGGTASQVEMNDLLDQRLKRLSPSYCFFFGRPRAVVINDSLGNCQP